MRSDLRAIDRGLLAKLFPFHLIIDTAAEPRIVDAGPALLDWSDLPLVDQPFENRFSVVRPVLSQLDTTVVAEKEDEVFFIKTNSADGRELRGQLVVIDDYLVLFAGSPVVTTSTPVEQLGLSISDFAPHDSTPDIIVLGRFAQMQINDLERQTDQLRQALEARDTFSEQAATDPMTMLPNRRAFWQRYDQWATSSTDEDSQAVLLYIDVDQFKAINDEHGHHAGDQVLCTIANRLTSVLRPTDSPARIGGDEFAVLLHLAADAQVDEIIDRIRQALMAPILHDARTLDVSVSIGVRLLYEARQLDEILRDADTAMYNGRALGRGRITWFEPEMGLERSQHRLLTQDLKTALDYKRIEPFFQPIVRLDDVRTMAVEALARWTHAEQGPIPPDAFVHLAENAGLVSRLDGAVMHQALQQLASWQRIRPDLGIQVNVSGRSIDKYLPDRVATALLITGVPPSSLTIEVTEGWLINGNEVIGVLNELADLGIRLHLDDFGTGFSSLAHLQAFPISGLKIDRSFVSEMMVSDRSRRLVEATISLAKSLELEVVAEGVEHEAEVGILSDLGCDYAQGYWFARPLGAADAGDYLQATDSSEELKPS